MSVAAYMLSTVRYVPLCFPHVQSLQQVSYRCKHWETLKLRVSTDCDMVEAIGKYKILGRQLCVVRNLCELASHAVRMI